MSKVMISTALATALAAIAAPAAMAGTPTGPWVIFKNCPYTNPNVGGCVVSTTKSGSLTIGSTTLPIDKPIVLQGGVESPFAYGPLYDAVGTPTLSAPPGKVPGGLLGIVNPAPDWPFPLWAAFWAAVGAVNDVSAIMEPIQTIHANLGSVLFPPTDGSDPTAVQLPVRVRLQNPFLGGTCYIGSAQTPIVIKLQSGTTNPPLPNHPISGSPGVAEFVIVDEEAGTSYIQNNGSTLVDNAFAVPAAKGCGNVALGLPIVTQLLDVLVSGAVNLKVGLPSAAGKNTAILNGDSSIGASQFVLDSEQ